jgi:hypothetical protein
MVGLFAKAELERIGKETIVALVPSQNLLARPRNLSLRIAGLRAAILRWDLPNTKRGFFAFDVDVHSQVATY